MLVKSLEGKSLADAVADRIKETISGYTTRKPGLAFVRVGNNPASQIYLSLKRKRCREVGIVSFDRELSEQASLSDVIAVIEELNRHPEVDGILVQLPLPKGLDSLLVLETISPEKDVDGFHPMNMGNLLLGKTGGMIPCTPKGIVKLLTEYTIPVQGKHVVIAGRSNIVGKPLAALLLQNTEYANATVTVVHSRSEHKEALYLQADILIAAVGKSGCIRGNMIKEGAVVIDVGINKIENNGTVLITGDVDAASAKQRASALTPVPGGVGPLTIAMLLENTLLAYQRRMILEKGL